jgi:hypothetical protein
MVRIRSYLSKQNSLAGRLASSRHLHTQAFANSICKRTPNTVGARILRKKTLRCKNTQKMCRLCFVIKGNRHEAPTSRSRD